MNTEATTESNSPQPAFNTRPLTGDHSTDVLYPAIEAAMKELDEHAPAGFNHAVDRAYNLLHGAFWSECPAPASAAPLRTVPIRAD